MPGMGLTSIGLAGVVLAYAEIAHTFIDGMHALAGLTMFVGLIILAVGILDGGVSTSNRAKATVLVILSISLGFGTYAFTFNTISTSAMFAGILMAIAAPATIIAYISMKHTKFVKPVSVIFILGSVAGIAAFVGFGVIGPSPYLISEEAEIVEEEIIEEVPTGPEFRIAMLEGSAEQGNPDYDPDEARVPQGHVVVWVNEDTVAHTSTSEANFGETFDTSLINGGEEYRLDTTDLAIGEYPYLCIVHPWMVATLIIEEPKEPVIAEIGIPDGAGINEPGRIYYDPEIIEVEVGTTVVWTNLDTAAHTVTSGSVDTGVTDLFDSGLMGAAAVYEQTFSEEGRYDYFCILHPWMEGTVIVS